MADNERARAAMEPTADGRWSIATSSDHRPEFTPEATVGPFFPGALVANMPHDLVHIAPLLAMRPDGQPLSLTGRVLDSLDKPVEHAILEFWQANAHGRYRHPQDRSERPLDPHFDGFARVCTDRHGCFRLVTVKPGAHAGATGNTVRAPHLHVTLFASGVDRLYTQVFFADDPLNASDPLLASIPAAHRDRLIAARIPDSSEGMIAYRIDLVMRGDAETPFFDDSAFHFDYGVVIPTLSIAKRRNLLFDDREEP
jgi:protocatechuate 3,4-dioxygenase alpha subunit